MVVSAVLIGCKPPTGPTIGPSISGTVTLAGVGVKGVTVTAGSQSAVTDANGKYTITGLASGSVKVTPTLTNYDFSPASQSETVSGKSISGVNFDSGPAIPVPASYSDTSFYSNNRSPEVLVSVKKLNGVAFSPTIGGAYLQSDGSWVTTSNFFSGTSGCPIDTSNLSTIPSGLPNPCYEPGRVTLVDSSGTVVANPTLQAWTYAYAETCTVPTGATVGCDGVTATSANVSIKPLTQAPMLELVAYWQPIQDGTNGYVVRYPAGTTTTEQTSYTYGVSQTSSVDFSNTVSVSATSGVTAGPASVSTTVSDTYSTKTSNSMTLSNSTTTSQSFSVNVPSNKEGVYVIWQLVYQLRLVRKATSSDPASSVDPFGYVAFSDPNFLNGTTSSFTTADMAPLDIAQQNDIVPLMTFFPAS